MVEVNDTIHVNVEYSTEDEEYGPVYVASCVEIAAVTDGKTLDELFRNIVEMIHGHLEDTDTVAEFNLVPNPRIVITMELPENYAQTA
jgi:predicted RNase H-like HicB family nuclease